MSCEVARAYLIGPGEVGRRLLAAFDAAAFPAVALGRGDGLARAADPADPALRVVAVREEDLGAVLGALAGVPRERLVLVQNGFLEVVHGDLGDVTRGLIWFTSKADFFRELQPSLFFGPRAADVAALLGAGGLRAEALAERRAFLREMVLKGLWNCAVGLPPAVRGVDLRRYLEAHGDELAALLAEGARVGSAAYGVDVDAAQTVERLRATTRDLGWLRGSTKALAWRNGALATLGRRHGIPTPVNDALLAAAGGSPSGAWSRGRSPGARRRSGPAPSRCRRSRARTPRS